MAKLSTTIENITKGHKVRQEPHQIDRSKTWKIYVDGASNSLGASAGVVLISLEGTIF